MRKITLGRVIKNARNELNLTQEELLALIVDSNNSRYPNKITILQLFQIEEDLLIDINDTKWDWLPSSLAAAFNVDRSWLEMIRRQTFEGSLRVIKSRKNEDLEFEEGVKATRKMFELVEEWMKEDPSYDREVYPQLEKFLRENRL